MSECDPSLPAHLVREFANQRVILIAHVVAAVEMKIDIDVVLFCQLEHAADLRRAILVVAGGAAHHRRAALEAGDQVLIGPLYLRPAFLQEDARLGRENIESLYALKQITDTGVRVWLYSTDQERKLDTPIEKLMQSISNYASEQERVSAKTRTYDGMLRRAKAGHSTGGRTYGL